MISAYQSDLYADRIKLKNPDDHVIFPDLISKEPLGPAVRHSDSKWEDIVRWTLYAMLEAEELKVCSSYVNQLCSSTNPAIRRLLGVEGDISQNLGLKADWAYQIIKQVGNYQEVFDRHCGKDGGLQLCPFVDCCWKRV